MNLTKEIGVPKQTQRFSIETTNLSTEPNNPLISDRIPDLEEDTKRYIEDLQGGESNILVYFRRHSMIDQVVVRNRPLNEKELAISNFETITVLDDKVVILLDPRNQFDFKDVNTSAIY